MAASKKQRIAGWVVSGIIAAFLIVGSASGKFRDFPGKAEMFEHLGYKVETMTVIGVVEVLVTVLYLIPRTAFLGAILLSAYLGGAVATHARVGEPIVFPILLGVIAGSVTLCAAPTSSRARSGRADFQVARM